MKVNHPWVMADLFKACWVLARTQQAHQLFSDTYRFVVFFFHHTLLGGGGGYKLLFGKFPAYELAAIY